MSSNIYFVQKESVNKQEVQTVNIRIDIGKIRTNICRVHGIYMEWECDK